MNTTNLHEGDIHTDNRQAIVLNTSCGMVIVPAEQIIRIQAISNYSKLFFNNGKTLVVAKVLRWFEEQENLVSFIRIHRSRLLNLQYVKNYNDKHGSICLHTGETFMVAKRKKSVLSECLGQCVPVLSSKPIAGISLNIKKTIAA